MPSRRLWLLERALPVSRRRLIIADAGFKVYLVEKSPSVGGRMAQLDKTFPTPGLFRLYSYSENG